MLEKVLGNKLITKLRAILLMEADFNAANKIVYGEMMLGLARVLFYDIVQQLKVPAGLASVDAANCYDRVAHAISSMIFQAFDTSANTCKSIHSAIQDVQFFLRTAFGDSSKSVGSHLDLKTQGYMQGNGATPAGWAVVSITIIHAHKKEGHGATFLCPVTKLLHNVAEILYVDDVDIIHLNLEGEETLHEAHAALQASLTSWSQLLIATGVLLSHDLYT
jgi:hypothetical protein